MPTKEYKEYPVNVRRMIDGIEKEFIRNPINKFEFTQALGFLINKYKRR
jgi:hypothetical protein